MAALAFVKAQRRTEDTKTKKHYTCAKMATGWLKSHSEKGVEMCVILKCRAHPQQNGSLSLPPPPCSFLAASLQPPCSSKKASSLKLKFDVSLVVCSLLAASLMPGTSTARTVPWLIVVMPGTSTAKMVHYTCSLLAASLQPPCSLLAAKSIESQTTHPAPRCEAPQKHPEMQWQSMNSKNKTAKNGRIPDDTPRHNRRTTPKHPEI